MLYWLLKFPARLCLWILCRRISINNGEALNYSGPLLIAANHPNSFLDAIILSVLFKKPVHSLARGDAFKNSVVGSFIRNLNMLPVYRTSEGVENLDQNYLTFEACKTIFKRKGIVLIFSEGRCINEWRLRPLKKGTARLAISSWENGIDLQILPCGINYQSFGSFGKNVQINFGPAFSSGAVDITRSFGKNVQSFNEHLRLQLKELVIEIDSTDQSAIRREFEVKPGKAKKTLLAIPAVLGYLSHYHVYKPLQRFVLRKFGHNDHYDSVITGALFFTYPIYLCIVSLAVALITPGYWWLLTWILLPFFAWSFVQLKNQF